MTDTEIVELYWARSDQAIPETASRYGAYCHTVACHILADREDAEECVNDTWLKAWNSMPTNRPSHLAPYLARMTRWLSLSRLRERNSLHRGGGELPLVLEELTEAADSTADPAVEVEQQELNLAVRKFLSTLAETERKVFLARYWYLAPIEEISTKFHFSKSKVTSMLFRTRKKLLFYLKEEGLC